MPRLQDRGFFVLMAAKIYLQGIKGKDKYALVDDEDFEKVSQFKWYLHKHGYAVTAGSKTKMHRFILNATKKEEEVDHVNHNGLDNRRTNIRICTHAQNMFNKNKQINNKSGYKGVYWEKQGEGFWRARIQVKGKGIHLGVFDDILAAAEAYNKAAKQYFGEYGRGNYGFI